MEQFTSSDIRLQIGVYGGKQKCIFLSAFSKNSHIMVLENAS